MTGSRRSFLKRFKGAAVSGDPQGFLSADRRAFLKTAATGAVVAASARAVPRSPNIILIVADDLGYADLGCYGSNISTPNLDRMAQEGMRFTHFNAASAVCSPSRAALMTGRYPARVGVNAVLDPTDATGLSLSETTMAQMLKTAGYATTCVGKWHLGNRPEFLPTNRGFDEYFGVPYSIDMFPRVLMHNTDVVEQGCNLENLTERYTQAAVDVVNRSKSSPFFLYLPHAFPHVPYTASRPFVGNSGQGLYGDTIQEIDASVGRILQALKDNGIDSNTLVMFSSDHGPWYQGSTGGLRGRKGETFEGGMRVPLIARFPGSIPGGQVSRALATNMDIMPTVAGLAGAALPANPLDGVDIWPVLSGEQADVPREAFLYFSNICLQAARLGPWKLHVTRFNTQIYSPDPPGGRINLPLPNPELYNLVGDPDETHDRADRNQAIVADLRSRMERLVRTFPPEVQNSWSSTLGLKVYSTPAGSLPIQAT